MNMRLRSSTKLVIPTRPGLTLISHEQPLRTAERAAPGSVNVYPMPVVSWSPGILLSTREHRLNLDHHARFAVCFHALPPAAAFQHDPWNMPEETTAL